jgi:hypothetical protein
MSPQIVDRPRTVTPRQSQRYVAEGDTNRAGRPFKARGTGVRERINAATGRPLKLSGGGVHERIKADTALAEADEPDQLSQTPMPFSHAGEVAYSQGAIRDFEEDYPSDPDRAISRLVEQLAHWEAGAAFAVSPVEVAVLLLKHLPKASYGRQNLLIAALTASVCSLDVVKASVMLSSTSPGPEILKATAGLLEHYGKAAWSALQWLVSNDRWECRYFIQQIAACDGVSENIRLKAIARLAYNPDPETRSEVADLLESDSLSDPTPVRRALAEVITK